MFFEDDVHKVASAIVLALGLLANILLSLSLAQTWKYWRQVRWYVLILVLSNWAEVVFDFIMRLVPTSDNALYSTTASCSFMMFATSFGPVLGAMSVAAMSVHVLITAISGCQGNRLRHTLVIGLFVLLSLPFPLFRLANSGLERHGRNVLCVVYSSTEFLIGTGICMVFFPCLVILCALTAVAVLSCVRSKDKEKGDVRSSDAVISALLGLILLVTCLPVDVYLFSEFFQPHASSLDLYFGLWYMMDFRNIFSAIAVAVFSYASVYRHREVTPIIDSYTPDEKQRLVNKTAVP